MGTRNLRGSKGDDLKALLIKLVDVKGFSIHMAAHRIGMSPQRAYYHYKQAKKNGL